MKRYPNAQSSQIEYWSIHNKVTYAYACNAKWIVELYTVYWASILNILLYTVQLLLFYSLQSTKCQREKERVKEEHFGMLCYHQWVLLRVLWKLHDAGADSAEVRSEDTGSAPSLSLSVSHSMGTALLIRFNSLDESFQMSLTWALTLEYKICTLLLAYQEHCWEYAHEWRCCL